MNYFQKKMSDNYPEARIIRSEALQWWALLPPEDKFIYCEAHYGVERVPSSLTGREIEKIYSTAKD